MKILVLGCGMQGRAVIYDLLKSDLITEIVGADMVEPTLDPDIFSHLDKFSFVKTDGNDRADLSEKMDCNADIIVDMLPRELIRTVTELAVEIGTHLVNANYAKGLDDLHDKALAKGISIMPEMGFDPGIDLVIAGEAARQFDEIHELHSYGGGLPEAAAIDNPLKYKITWTFAGVLDSTNQDTRMMKDGEEIHMSAQDIYGEKNIHTVDIPGVGELDAIYNRDAMVFAEKFGIEKTVKSTGRYTLRWSGFAPIIHTWMKFGMLSKEPLDWLPDNMSPQDYLCKLLEPQLQLGEQERDVCILRVDVKGIRNGNQERQLYHVIDYRDLETGFTAMNRTVGFPASIVAQMILKGEIKEKGLLSPIHHTPYDSFIKELGKRGIKVIKNTN